MQGKPYAGNPHVRFDEGEVASCTAAIETEGRNSPSIAQGLPLLRRVHCRRQPEGRASVCATTPRRGSLLYSVNTLNRGDFLKGACAAAAVLCGGCCRLGIGGDVRFGIISDTHVTGPESVAELARAFAFLRDRDIDAVIHCGDLTDMGYIGQLEAFAAAWRMEMPSEMPLIPVLGNRDLSDTRRMSEAVRTADRDRLILSCPREHFRRILGVDIADGIRAVWIRGVPVIAADWKHESTLEKFMRRHAELRDMETPFVYVQHAHPGGTVYGVNDPGDDPVTCWLNMFPRAVSVSGHSHLPFDDPRVFCRREFTAVGAGSHYLGGGDQQKGIREVSVLTIGSSGMRVERFGLHNGFRDEKKRSFPPLSRPDDPRPGSFVFAQWNVGGFCHGQDGAEGAAVPGRVEMLRRQVAALNADFIGLCEYSPQFKFGGQAASQAVFGSYAHSVAGPRLGANGNAVVSRGIPLSAARVFHYPRRRQQRYFVACEAMIGGAKTVIVQTHLDLDAPNRGSQLDQLLRQFKDEPYVIISADFNQAKLDEFKRFSEAGFKFANGTRFGCFLTHRRRDTSFTPAIDNLLVKGFDVLSVRTDDNAMLLSDHRILVCRLIRI